MIVRQTKNNLYNIVKLRNIYHNANQNILISEERISLIQKLLRKLIIKNILFKILTLFLYSYQKETLKVGFEELNEEKAKINNYSITFEYWPSQSSYVIDKLIVLMGQLRKMRLFYRLSSTFFSYDQIDIQEITRHYFQLSFRKDSKIILEDDLHIFEFNSLFIGKYSKKGVLLEIFSYDNVSIESKDIVYASKSKRGGLVLDKETWLYHLSDFSKDESFSDNYPLYIYKFRIMKITFKGKNTNHDFVFLGNELEKINLFTSLLGDYLRCLKNVYYELGNEKNFNTLPNEKILDLFYENANYSWIIFKILLEAEANIKLITLRKVYRLNCNDIIEVVKILKKYQFVNVSLGLELVPLYQKKAVMELESQLRYYFQAQIMRGHING